MNQKLKNKLIAILGRLPLEERKLLGKAIINDLTEICSLETLQPNRGSWTMLVVNVPDEGELLKKHLELVKSKGMRWCDFVANSLFVGASNLLKTGDVFVSPDAPKVSLKPTITDWKVCMACSRGRN